ncbi:Uncharacterised protein [Mycobacteroides abscessus subsp. abscessus]|nr:Uncharacterised protein [Mycobacteroides abscessus subsp. abscessus]
MQPSRRSGKDKNSILPAGDRFHLFIKHNLRIKGQPLLYQLCNQLCTWSWRQAADVPNHLFRINMYFSAKLRLKFNQFCFHFPEAAVKG